MKSLSAKDKSDLSRIFSTTYYKLSILAEELVASNIRLLFGKTGIADYIADNQDNTANIIKKLHFCDESYFAVNWMIEFLSWQKTRKQGLDLDRPPEVIKKQMIGINVQIDAFCRLSEYVFQGYPDFFKGKPGVEILFSKEGAGLWKEYFSNSNMGYNAYNLFGAKLAKNLLKGGVVCELGGGTGSGAKELLQTLITKRSFSSFSRYIFTDVSPYFLRLGMKNLEGFDVDKEFLEFKKLDFNLPFSQQGIMENSIAAFYGVNSLHAAHDLIFTLKEIHNSLLTDGVLLLSESVRSREYIPFQEVFFCLLGSYYRVVLDNKFRQTPGFLSIFNWTDALKQAGFLDVAIKSDLDYTLLKRNFPVAAVIAGRKK